MSGKRTHALLLRLALTDRTFARTTVVGVAALLGKCLHCGTKLAVALDGRPISDATVEHIVPRHHDGDDDLMNCAIACGPCNHGKGVRLDARRRDDPTLSAVIAALLQKRRERYRDVPDALRELWPGGG